MITDKQREERIKYIGSSDAAGVLAMSRWDTPLSVWAEKTGQYIKPEVESEAAELGKELEEYVSRRFERKTGKTVVRAPNTFFHPEYDFLGANVDRLVVDEDAILEAKTCSPWKSKEWEGDEIPQEYIIQAYHQMLVTGKRKVYLAVLIGNQDFKIKELRWDDKIINDLRDREIAFWDDFVVPKVMPAQIKRQDTEVLAGLFPVAAEGLTVQLTDEANILVEQLTALKEDSKNVENQIETTENQLKALLGEAETGTTSLYRVAWQNIRVRRFDSKAFELQHPELAKQFKPEKITRRFSYKPLKEEK